MSQDKILLALKIQSSMLASLGHLIVWQTRILSGAYRSRDLSQGESWDEENKRIIWRPLNDEEKLVTSLGSMDAHCHRIDDCAEEIKGIK